MPEELKEEALSPSSAEESSDVSSSGSASSEVESSSGDDAGSSPASSASASSDASSDVSSPDSVASPLEAGARPSAKGRGLAARASSRVRGLPKPKLPKMPKAPKLKKPNLDCITAARMGKFLLALGPALVITGLVMNYMIHKMFPGQIKSAAVIDSTHHPRYKSWASNAVHGGATRYYSFTFQSVTNPEAVLKNGEPPIYENKGPYVFDRKYKRVGVEFEDDGNVVTFAERVVTTFNAKKSRGKADDKITLVNPAWHQVVSVYRSETGMGKGAGSLILQKIGRAFNTTLLPTGAIDALHTGLHDAFGGMSLAFKGLGYPPNSFEAAWGGNCVSNGKGGKFCGIKDASVLEYSGLLKDPTSRLFQIAGQLCAVPGIQEHAIPAETAKKIWNETDKYSILNFEEEGATLVRQGTFHGLTTWVHAAHNETARDEIMRHFKLSRKQVDVVAQHLYKCLDSEPLFEEIKARYLATVPAVRHDDLAASIQTREDLIWRQMYAADVLPALKKKPDASLKKEAKFEFGAYAKAAGKPLEETGMSLDNLKCMFKYVADNRVDFEDKLWNIKRDWFDSGKVDDITGELAANKPPPDFDLCFPDVVALESGRGYVNYLNELFFKPEYSGFSETDGFVATKSAKDWILGNGPLELFAQSLLDEDDPRIHFAFLSSDEGGLDGQDGLALCHQSSDAVNPFTSCYRDEERRWIRGNFSMYTGKDDINKVGQWKRLNYREVMPVWSKDMPIDNGAAALAELYPWQGRKPLLPNHIDGLAVPPGLLDTAALNDTYISLFMDSLIAPFPLIYERDVVRKGIRLKRFVFHPDSLSDRRPDAEVFAPVVEDAPAELKNTLNLTLARAAYFFIGPKVRNVDVFNHPELEGQEGATASKKHKAKHHGRMLAAEVDGTGAVAPVAEEPVEAEQQQERPKLRLAQGAETIELERKKGPSDDVSYIEFEPVTGMAMKVNIVFQAYLSKLPAYLKHDLFTPEAWDGARAPFYEVRISQEASDVQAREYKLKVDGALKGAGFAKIGGILFGSMAFLGGAFLLTREWVRKRRGQRLPVAEAASGSEAGSTGTAAEL